MSAVIAGGNVGFVGSEKSRGKAARKMGLGERPRDLKNDKTASLTWSTLMAIPQTDIGHFVTITRRNIPS